MYIAGFICLLLGLLLSAGGGGLALLQLWEGQSGLLTLIRRISLGVAASLSLASAILLHALFWQDYSLEYVASYTDQYLPVFYRLTAFWAGQPGSLLFWASFTALCGWLWSCSREARTGPAACRLWFWVFFYFLTAFFCLLLACWSNPFIMLDPAPLDGSGLNPLLQNPGMIIHPPLLFMGYALFSVPACLALAQLLTPSGQNQPWFVSSRPYLLGGWILLTAGILIGAWWAYMELGWGGYWAWDPVENASLLPWLSACALLHALIIQRNTGKLAKTSVFLMGLTLLLTFLGTWLTRSGVIESVHAFGDGGVGMPLLLFVCFLLLLIICCLLAARTDKAPLAQPASREGALLLTAWIFLALLIIVLLATMWPLVSKMGQGLAQGLDAAFYNRVCLPVATLLLCLLAACPFCGWSGGLAGKHGLAQLMIIGSCFACACVITMLAGYRLPLPLIATAGAIAILAGILIKTINALRHKLPFNFAALGGHLGIAVIALGVAFSGPYTTEYELMLAKGEAADAGPLKVTLENISDGAGRGYDYLMARLNIAKDGQYLGDLTPERRIYAKYGAMQFSEVDVYSSPLRDIYSSLLGMDEDHRVLVRISIEPMVSLIWLGGLIMCLLPLAGSRRKNSG